MTIHVYTYNNDNEVVDQQIQVLKDTLLAFPQDDLMNIIGKLKVLGYKIDNVNMCDQYKSIYVLTANDSHSIEITDHYLEKYKEVKIRSQKKQNKLKKNSLRSSSSVREL